MAIKRKISKRGMVMYVLAMAEGAGLSLKEIQAAVLEKFAVGLDEKTVIRAIDEADFVVGCITEKSERRGALRLPTKVFGLEFSNVEI